MQSLWLYYSRYFIRGDSFVNTPDQEIELCQPSQKLLHMPQSPLFLFSKSKQLPTSIVITFCVCAFLIVYHPLLNGGHYSLALGKKKTFKFLFVYRFLFLLFLFFIIYLLENQHWICPDFVECVLQYSSICPSVTFAFVNWQLGAEA